MVLWAEGEPSAEGISEEMVLGEAAFEVFSFGVAVFVVEEVEEDMDAEVVLNDDLMA